MTRWNLPDTCAPTAAARIKALEAERDALREAVDRLEKAISWCDEKGQTCATHAARAALKEKPE